VSALNVALDALRETTTRLSELSRRSYQNPYTALTWPDHLEPTDGWFSSPELVSLYGTPWWAEMTEVERRKAAFWEAANFYSLNIHGEKTLMRGLAERLYRRDLVDVVDYLHHFLDEENKHSIYFGGFCMRYAKLYRSRQPSFPSQPARDVGDFLFFAKVMIFEEIADMHNQRQGRDPRLHHVARFINLNHHREEARHLVFGRLIVRQLWEAAAQSWSDEVRGEVREDLVAFTTASWREYYNPDVYADLGFTDPWKVADEAWAAREQRDRRVLFSRRCRTFLESAGILAGVQTDAF
jgi:hypothetical protein